MSFEEELSAINCIETLKNNGIKVTNIQILTEKINLDNALVETLSNTEFPHFVAEVESAMKNKQF